MSKCMYVCMYVYAHPADDEYMSKHTHGHELVLPNQHLVHVAADDDFETHLWTYVCIAKLTLSASCSWWYCYMSKRTCQQVLALPSWCLVDPAADDDFAICQNAHMDMCLCFRADV